MLDSDDEDYDMDDVLFPGSDDELGFEEIEIGDELDTDESQESDNEDLDSEDELAQGGERRGNTR